MIRIITLLLVSVAAFSTAEEIQFKNCMYPQSEGPSSANLKRSYKGFELEIKFWANGIGPNSPLKVQRLSFINYFPTNRLVYVFYPIQTASANDKYTEHTITLSIPETEINSDKVQFSLHKINKDGQETIVWCMSTSVRVLHGMKDEEDPKPFEIIKPASQPAPQPPEKYIL